VVLRPLHNACGKRLEKLKDDSASTYSIRLNDQWRICFRGTNARPENVEIVEIVDSHREDMR